MKLLCFLVVLLQMCGLVWPDVYLHSCRGSNNRLDEGNRERNNANRLFDSQNNNRGGYNVGGDGNREPDPMKFVKGSQLQLEWTNQHECGQNNTYCTVILQYMCAPHLRDGTNTNTININHYLNDNTGLQQGQHETQRSYADCQTRQQNGGLYHGDQDLNGGSAKFTRQNPDGTRRGLECPEERDYYPYWGPTEWTDIAILTDDQALCKEMAQESQNVKPRSYCRMTEQTLKSNPQASRLVNQKVKDEDLAPLSKQECDGKGSNYEWYTAPAFNKPAPECLKPPQSRDNHNGNSFVPGQEGSKKIPQTSTYMWTIPDDVNPRCALRLRYNISIGDYPPFETFSAADTPDDNRHICIADMPIAQAYGIDTKEEAKERGYHMENNPVIKPLKINGIVEKDLALELAINTAQTGRVFQDRSHLFSIIDRDSSIPDDAVIHNVNVRGKRGNIVQVYPAVEYDFMPNNLDIKKDDYVNFQWTGALTNPGNNDGEGQAKTDKSNIIVLKPRNFGGDQPDGRTGWPGNSYPENINTQSILNLGRNLAIDAALPSSVSNTITTSRSYTIRCTDGRKLDIKYAHYGRTSYMCGAPSAYSVLASKCNGETSCQLEASTSLFGSDPCPGKTKYVTVRYGCAYGIGASASPGGGTGGTSGTSGGTSASPNLAGSVWDWYHNGRTKNGEITLTTDGKVKWNNGGSQGSWSVNNNIITTTFNRIYHRLQLDGSGTSAVLLQPRRNPQSKMIKQGGSGGTTGGAAIPSGAPLADGTWQTLSGHLAQISAGGGEIVGVNKYNQVYLRTGTSNSNPKGTGWMRISGTYKYAAAGDNKIVAVNNWDDPYIRMGVTASRPGGTYWKSMGGKVKQVSIGDDKIVGVSNQNRVYYRTGISQSNPAGSNWKEIGGRMGHITVGDGKIMGISSGGYVYYRDNVSGGRPEGTNWRQMSGRLKMIDVGAGKIVGVNYENKIYERRGISSTNPYGTTWQQVPGSLKAVAVDVGKAVGVSQSGAIAAMTWSQAPRDEIEDGDTKDVTWEVELDEMIDVLNDTLQRMEKMDSNVSFLPHADDNSDIEPQDHDEEVYDDLMDLVEDADPRRRSRRRRRRRRRSNQSTRRTQQQQRSDPKKAILDASSYYVNLHPQKITACGTTHYMCTRNNNFSNRGQKGTITVKCDSTPTVTPKNNRRTIPVITVQPLLTEERVVV